MHQRLGVEVPGAGQTLDHVPITVVVGLVAALGGPGVAGGIASVTGSCIDATSRRSAAVVFVESLTRGDLHTVVVLAWLAAGFRFGDPALTLGNVLDELGPSLPATCELRPSRCTDTLHVGIVDAKGIGVGLFLWVFAPDDEAPQPSFEASRCRARAVLGIDLMHLWRVNWTRPRDRISNICPVVVGADHTMRVLRVDS